MKNKCTDPCIHVIEYEKKLKKMVNVWEQIVEDLIDVFVVVRTDLSIELSNKKWRELTSEIDETIILEKLKKYIDRVLRLKLPMTLNNFKIGNYYYDFSIYKFNGGVAILGRDVTYGATSVSEEMSRLGENITEAIERLNKNARKQ